jgi:hypothetical protein
MTQKLTAEPILLDRMLFRPDSEKYARFVELLEAARQPNAALRKRLLQQAITRQGHFNNTASVAPSPLMKDNAPGSI